MLVTRKPKSENFESILSLVNHYAEKREMLPLTMDELCHRIEGFRILKNEKDELIACAHLDVFTPELAEVKSLAVMEDHLAQGYGKVLVAECEKEARKLGIKKLFALTFKEKFFKKLGFVEVPRDSLPEKIYRECVQCAYHGDCKEVAVIKVL